MENVIKSVTVLTKNLESKKVLKDVEVSFEVFKSEFIELTKEVDRPNDYYFEEDKITYTLKLKNVGTKNIVGFTLKDDIPSRINPLDNGFYDITVDNGEVSFECGHLIISNINLMPQEILIIKILGKVKVL